MTVQPDNRLMPPQEAGSGYVDYESLASQVPMQSRSMPVGTSYDPMSDMSSMKINTDRPTIFKNTARFYANGPYADPFDRAASEASQIDALIRYWQAPEKRRFLNNYTRLLLDYGHTNSPGTLWAIASNGLDPNTQAIQSLLRTDAKAAAQEYGESAPATASSPAKTEEASFAETFWTPVQFAARNAFAALSMPMEAVQGTLRGIGGALTEEGGPDVGKAAMQFLSMSLPPLALAGEAMYGDNEFQNPWEQTEFGQTLLTASAGAGFDAFTGAQAGLDVERAKQEILQDPQYADLQNSLEGLAKLDYLATQRAKEKGYYGNPGWFVDETSRVGEAQRQSTFQAWAIPGPDNEMTAWTLGRGIAAGLGGPDWTAYGVASGVIDAVAAVALDPTLFVGKFGLASKAVKGLSGGKALVGMEAAKARKAQAAYNASVEALAKKTNTPLEVIAEYGLEDLANLAKQYEIGTYTTEAMKNASAQTKRAKKLVAQQRRNRTLADKAVNAAVVPQARLIVPEADANTALDIVTTYIDDVFVEKPNGKYAIDKGRVYDHWARTVGPDEERLFAWQQRGEIPPTDVSQIARSDANRIYNETITAFERRRKRGLYKGMTTRDAFIAFRDDINGQITGAPPRPKPARLTPEAATAQVNDLIEAPDFTDTAQAMRQIETSGATLSSLAEPGMIVYSKVDGLDAVTAWVGKASPVIVDATEIVPAVQRDRIRAALDALLSRDEMRGLDRPLEDTGGIADAIATKLANATDLTTALDETFASPILSWRRLYAFMQQAGLDTAFDDILRTGDKGKRIDGISGLLGVAGRGVWMGDHPELVSYALRFDAAADGTVTTRAAERLGIRGMDPATAQKYLDDRLADAEKANSGLMAHRADRMMEAERQQIALDDLVRQTEEAFAAPEGGLRKTLSWHAGLRYSRTGGYTVDERAVREFLFGIGPLSHLANKTLDALADYVPEATRKAAQDAGEVEYNKIVSRAGAEIVRIVGDKWDVDTVMAVARNAVDGGGREGLIGVLAPRLGIGGVERGSLSKTTRLQPGDGKTYLRTWRTWNPTVVRMLGTMPGGRAVNLVNSDDVITQLLAYGRYAKVDEDKILDHVANVLNAHGTIEMSGVSRNAFTGLFDDIRDRLIQEIDESGTVKRLFRGESGKRRKQELLNGIARSTRLYLGGLTDESKDNIKLFAENRGVRTYTTSDGLTVEMQGLQIDAEIASGMLNLPSVDEWSKVLKRTVTALSRYDFTESVYDITRRVFDNFFRTSMLAFRISYILRNAAEMQVRMYLNGHKSAFSDPMTLAGMTIGNLVQAKRTAAWEAKVKRIRAELRAERGVEPSDEEVKAITGERRESWFERMYAPYSDTVLGTKFEVGTDEALAVANNVEEHFALIRLARSLTDPRVYNTGVRDGWQAVAYGTAGFTQGWANELIMLNKSRIAKLVVRTQGSEDAKIMAIEALRNSDEYATVRGIMISGNEKFRQIFASEELTRAYLFDNPDSIAARIIDYTDNEPALLEFIATGRYQTAVGKAWALGSVPDAADRVKQLSQRLGTEFTGDRWARHFTSREVKVPWIENIDKRNGVKYANKFFDVANTIERISTVGPEFRLAYWDKVAELVPALRAAEVPRALKAARTTLGPLKRMADDGKLDSIGSNHPAWAALKKQADTGDGGMLTLDEIHAIASKHAANTVRDLFYDATRRNNTWMALRLLFPFGQAWGNTIETWAKLGAKKPIQVYKAQKALNALQESGSSAIYEFGQEVGAYGQYAPGFAPWDQDTNGGFFYSDKYGGTSFMMPFAGRLAAAPLNVMGWMNGIDAPNDLPVQSPASSLNFALGGDSILPGFGPMVGFPLSTGVLPDNDLVGNLRQIVTPFGEKDILGTMIPAWLAKVIGGVGSLPGNGLGVGNSIDALSPANRDKHMRDAMAILASSGNYPNWGTDDQQGRRLRDDAQSLAKAMLLTTGLLQNVMPSTPITSGAMQLQLDGVEEGNTALAAVGMMNTMFQQYRPRNGYDDTAAREEFVKDFGAAALYATIGDWASLSRVPTSQALDFAYQHPEIARANFDQFQFFFPQGDSSDVVAVAWANKYGFGNNERKTKDQIYNEVISYLQRVQTSRVNSMVANNLLSEEDGDKYRDEIQERYLQTGAARGVFVNKSLEMQQFKEMWDEYEPIRNSQAGVAFGLAWDAREAALKEARKRTGRDNATLGAKDTAEMYAWFVEQVNRLEQVYPDFKLLAAKFRKEWD